MKKKIYAIILFIILTIVETTSIIGQQPNQNITNNIWDRNELLKLINQNKSIMYIEPHPDDEVYSPGVLIIAGSKNNNCWIVSLIGMNSPPYNENITLRIKRLQAIKYLEDNYLQEYIMLNMPRIPNNSSYWHGWSWTYKNIDGTWNFSKIKNRFRDIILDKQPDIIITFTPKGYMNKTEGEHSRISNIVTNIIIEENLDTRVFWFINIDQGPRMDGPYYEYNYYPPTSVLNLNVFSQELNKTYWIAKVILWNRYSQSVNALLHYMQSNMFPLNDRKEYYTEARYTINDLKNIDI